MSARGRPAGTKNRAHHKAGGAREGAGRKGEGMVTTSCVLAQRHRDAISIMQSRLGARSASAALRALIDAGIMTLIQ